MTQYKIHNRNCISVHCTFFLSFSVFEFSNKILRINLEMMRMIFDKGQLILKCLFGVFNFFQRTKKNKSIWGFMVHSKVESFVRFWEKNVGLKNSSGLCLTFINLMDSVAYCYVKADINNFYKPKKRLKGQPNKLFTSLLFSIIVRFMQYVQYVHK